MSTVHKRLVCYREEMHINTAVSPHVHTDKRKRFAVAAVDITRVVCCGTRLETAFKLPPSVSGYKEHKAGYDYLQESDASCPPTLELKLYPT